MTPLRINRVAVLGAGVMGAQIAAHFANADVAVLLFDLAAKEGDPSGIAKKAIAGLKKLEPPPLAAPDRLAWIEPANYDHDLHRLAGCDLVIEAIAEKMEWKNDLFRRVVPLLPAHAIIASNTSGLSVNRLAEALPEASRPNFCGIHFFNPPRYMHLVELIATTETRPELLDGLEAWLTTRLGKGIVRALDTPNFVANRVGVFAMLAAMHHTTRLGLGCDVVDALTGPAIGRPKSATYRTADVVGLDTLAHVVKTMHDTLADDPWHGYFVTPDWIAALIAQGALGQKTRQGIFKKEGKKILVLDVASRDYRESAGDVAAEVQAILKNRSVTEKFSQLRASNHPQAQFLWATFRDVFHYVAVQLEHVANNARDVDFALRWGFGWSQGPFETWQAAGWKAIATAINDDIAAGKTMSAAPLPSWVLERDGVHEPDGSWSVSARALQPRSTLPCYQRQLFRETVLGDGSAAPEQSGETLWENAGVRLWRLPDVDEKIAIVSVKSKMHALGRDEIAGLQEAVRRAEQGFDGLVIWHEAPFAVGANLKEMVAAAGESRWDELEEFLTQFQLTAMGFKYARVPVVAAVQGMALGGGCEFQMHCTRRVLALESYIGLVEVGVGLIPGGGGCKEFALRAARLAALTPTNDPLAFIQPAFQTIAMATVAKSALEAKALGFARESDSVVFHPRELLLVAIREARALAEAGWHPPLPARGVKVAGRTGIATLEMMLANMKEGGMISAHDYTVGRAVATALCGGDVDAGSLVDETWLLKVERQQFMNLAKTEKTRARIAHMLEAGKPLRN